MANWYGFDFSETTVKGWIVAILFVALFGSAPAFADCVDPAGPESKIVYNTSYQVFQYCDGTDWIAMHGAGFGSGGCTDPDRPEGRMVYNPPHRVMQGCAGNVWRAMGPIDGAGGAYVGNCTDPDRPAGALKYNPNYRVMEYCDGADWILIGKKIDLTPDAFTFTDQVGAALSTLVESDIVLIAGIKTIAAVSVAGDGSPQYRICDDALCSTVDQDWGGAAGSIGNGQHLQLRLTSNPAYGAINSATVAVGTASDQWDVTTEPQDTAPDAFSFTDQTGIALNTLTSSNIVNIAGITGNVPVSISGDGNPQISINGGGWTTSGTIQNGQTLQLRVTSSASATTMTSAAVTVGAASDQWDVTTGAGCGGTLVGGYCWYIGAAGESCNTVCSSHGGTDNATINYAGTSGTNAQCQSVMNALGFAGIVKDTPWLQGCCTVVSCSSGNGCGYTTAYSVNARCTSPATVQADSSGTYRRACACAS